MSTYLGWNVVVMPGTPPAPQSMEITIVEAVAMNLSPFTGQQQVQDWGGSWLEANVSMPPMRYSDAQAWVAFLKALKGVAGVFQFSAAFGAGYPNDVGSLYWRMKTGTLKYSINQNHLYGMQFEIRQAL